jgi:hypothetical protein
MKLLAALLVALLSALASAEKILLIPLDSRPATGQFALMVAKMAAVDVLMPPYEDLGRFTDPGRPDDILAWLESQDLKDVSAVVCSADMIEYGGLIASRTGETTAQTAIQRMNRLVAAVRREPHVRLYVFSATMRLLPTATSKASRYAMALGQYEEAKAKYMMTEDGVDRRAIPRLRRALPAGVIQQYEATRQRNHAVQEQLIRMQAAGNFDYLIVGQDDARPYGPHVPETVQLRRLTDSLKAQDQVFFCEGVDQHACVLVSRALLQEAQWQPRVRVVYSDDQGKDLFASYESKPIKDSLSDQLLASGARPAGPSDEYDYTLYLNTPRRREANFQQFVSDMASDIDQGFPTAVADIDLARNGTADPELFQSLWENRRMMRLISYAGWNTAGNTMGTAIPAANVYLLARRSSTVDPLEREVAQREFLLHRLVNDYAYHMYTRPRAYQMIEDDGIGTSEEIYGSEYDKVNAFVQRDLTDRLMDYFNEQFMGQRFFAGTEQYEISGIEDIKVWLPWPRPYEVRLEFHLNTKPVDASTGASPPPSQSGQGLSKSSR